MRADQSNSFRPHPGVNFLQPEGLEDGSRWSRGETGRDHRDTARRSAPRQGCQNRCLRAGLRLFLAPLRGAAGQMDSFRWSLPLCPERPPATICQPFGLEQKRGCFRAGSKVDTHAHRQGWAILGGPEGTTCRGDQQNASSRGREWSRSGLAVKISTAAMAWGLGLAVWNTTGAELEVEIVPQFNGAPLVFDAVTNRTGAGQMISVTRLDFMGSEFALRRDDGSWVSSKDWQAYICAREGRTRFRLADVPEGKYEAVRFLVGLAPEINRGDSAQYPPEHPLNPNVNGLHWGWQGGYVFLAMEGAWRDDSVARGYSFHLANEPQLMKVELPVRLAVLAGTPDLSGSSVGLGGSGRINPAFRFRLALDVAKIFDGQHRVTLAENNSATHSRTNDALALQLHRNVEGAFSHRSSSFSLSQALDVTPNKLKLELQRAPLIAPNATPYPLTISRLFPQPALPLDNPLTEEGVVLGRKLFSDPRLSVNNAQSCASCHQQGAAFSEAKPVSTGAEGHQGTRNAMALFNLAWKSSFFWDGRAATLREQVLQPIQNPKEMHESLSNVVAKLTDHGYSDFFSRAFGQSEITPERMARALEQF